MPTLLYPSPIGFLRLVASASGIREIVFDAQEDEDLMQTSDPILNQCLSELKSYFAGKLQRFEVPLDIQGTVFQKQAWAALRAVPYGQTMSYQEQAVQIDREHAYRAVANANAANPIPVIIPCHRIIRATGELGGYAGGLDKKVWLLEHEQRTQ